MLLHAMHRLYAYNRWANEQILSSAANLRQEQFLAPDDTPFGSVRNQLVHLIGAQHGWVGIWKSKLTGAPPNFHYHDAEDYPDYQSVLALWETTEAETAELLDLITEEQLALTITAEFDWGDITAPLWEMMVSMVNHGTQHRSEVAMKLTSFGYSPGMMDILFFTQMAAESTESEYV